MATYEVTLKDRSRETIDGADAYQQEGQMTTFFATAAERALVDSWSTRIASFRTSEVLVIRRLADAVRAGAVAPSAPAGPPAVPSVAPVLAPTHHLRTA